MKIHELKDIVQRARKPVEDKIGNAPTSDNREPKNLPDTPGHCGPNTVTGKGGGGIIENSDTPTQY